MGRRARDEVADEAEDRRLVASASASRVVSGAGAVIAITLVLQARASNVAAAVANSGGLQPERYALLWLLPWC